MSIPPVPAEPDTERRTSYTATAQTGPFDVGFDIYGDGSDYQDWLQVFVGGSLLTGITDWQLSSASGALNAIPRPITDAQITFTVAQTGTVEIVGARRPRRTSQYTESQPVPARATNQVLTDIWMTLREIWDRLMSRTATALPGETIGFLPSLANRLNSGVGSLAGYDGLTGDPIAIAADPTSFANYTAINYTANSTTSQTIGTGSKTFTVETGKSFVVNQYVLVMPKANNANNMLGKITDYSGSSMTVSVVATSGSGTLADWTIVLANSVPAAGFQPPIGSGSFTGPGSATAGHLVTFADGTGQVGADGGPAGALAGLSAVTAQYLANSAIAYGVGMLNGTLAESNSGGAPTFAVKTLAGNDPSAADPVYFMFRDATPGTGDFVVRQVTAALSLTISAGSTLGFSNSTPGRLWIAAFDDAGTVRLAVINCLSNSGGAISIYPLSGWGIASTVADSGGASDLAQTFYTANGHALSSKAYHVLGYMTWEAGLSVAGTWDQNPTRIQLYRAGVKLPGDIVQAPAFATGALATGSTQIPFDDTIPQNTEGDQYMSLSVTPVSAANILEVSALAQLSPSAVSIEIITALFQDSVANALAVASFFSDSTAGTHFASPPGIIYRAIANITSLTTFKLRAGPSSAATLTFNGSAGARKFGGAMNSYMTIKEICA